MKKILLSICATVLMTGCGINEIGEQKLQVFMYGVNQASTGATGSVAPRALNVTLNSISITDTDGTPKVLDSAMSYNTNIINRQQIIFEKDIADLEGNSYTSATLNFASDAVIVGKYNDLNTTLEDDVAEMVISDAFTIQPGQGVSVYIKIKWANFLTIDDENGEDQVDTDVTLEFDKSIIIE